MALEYGQMEEDKEKAFELGKIYKKFYERLENINESEEEKQNNGIYIIPKEFIDNFKDKIKYKETKEYFNENGNDKENLEKFKEKLKDYTYEDLDSILCADINIYSDLTEIQDNFEKGIEFVNSEFLDKLDFEENFDIFCCHFYKEKNNICIEFDNKSKLLINKEEGQVKYHLIDPPFQKFGNQIVLKRTKTVSLFSNKRSKTRKENLHFKKCESKTIEYKPEDNNDENNNPSFD